MYNIRPPSVGRFFLFPRIFIFGGAVNMKECQYNPVIYHHNRVSWALPSLKHNKTNVQLGGIICHIDLHNLVKYFHPSRQPWILIAGIIWLRVKLSLLLCCCPPTAEIRERERERERLYKSQGENKIFHDGEEVFEAPPLILRTDSVSVSFLSYSCEIWTTLNLEMNNRYKCLSPATVPCHTILLISRRVGR